MKKHAAPIIAAFLLLLPVLYVGSYLLLVVPKGRVTGMRQATALEHQEALCNPGQNLFVLDKHHYRYGRRWSACFFWPLEQIDRKVRLEAWEPRPNPFDDDFVLGIATP
jgi:hypothetical protein